MSKNNDTYEMLDNSPEPPQSNNKLLVTIIIILLIIGVGGYFWTTKEKRDRLDDNLVKENTVAEQTTSNQQNEPAQNPGDTPPNLDQAQESEMLLEKSETNIQMAAISQDTPKAEDLQTANTSLEQQNVSSLMKKPETQSDLKTPQSEGQTSSVIKTADTSTSAARQPEIMKHVVHFNFDEYTPQPSEIETLEIFGSKFKNQTGELIIEGHTDSNGAEKYNEILSSKRANNIAGLLKKYDLGQKLKITIEPKGELSPIADNSTSYGRSQNRRVELLYKFYN